MSAYLRPALGLADPPTSWHLMLLPKLRLLPSPPLRKKPRLQDSVWGIMPPSTPPSMQRPVPTAALGVLENLSSSSSNVSKTIVKSTVDRGSISEGMSQEVAKTLLRAEKLRHQSANK